MTPRHPTTRPFALGAVLALVFAAAAALVPASPAAACGPSGGSDGTNFTGTASCTTPTTTTTGVNPGAPVYFEWGLDFVVQDGVALTIPLSMIPFLGLPDIDLPNGCFQIVATSGPLDEPPAQNTYDEAAADLAATEGGETWNPCPGGAFDIVAYVTQFWETQVRPPPPSPLQVDPGKALTGLPAYLEIGGEVPVTWTLPNPIGADITISATPRYVVDWGDGTGTTETTSQGGPYPDGDLTHTYTETGGVTLTVQAYWSGEWSAGGDGGDLGELATPTESDLDLPVEQRQVVIDPE